MFTTKDEICTTVPLLEELLIEILSWLPVKSLLRFRCVSKTWCHWISFDSRFIKLHLDRSNKNPGLIVSYTEPWNHTQLYYLEDCVSHDDAPLSFEVPFRNPHGVFQLVNACNGLLCLTDEYDHLDYSNVYVWNPLTRDHLTIWCPPFPPQFSTEEENEGHLDEESRITYGFGFNETSNEYKVLRLVSRESGSPEFESDVSVYTLGTDSWRILGDIMDYEIDCLCVRSRALVNGALHWFAIKARPSVIANVLVSFDLQAEFFREIPQPQYTDADEEGEDDISCLVEEASGLLRIFRKNLAQNKVQIWMMNEYGVVDSWFKQFDVSLYEFPLGVANNEEIVALRDLSQVILCNTKTNSIRSLHNFGFQLNAITNYTGSLLYPTMINTSSYQSV